MCVCARCLTEKFTVRENIAVYMVQVARTAFIRSARTSDHYIRICVYICVEF